MTATEQKLFDGVLGYEVLVAEAVPLALPADLPDGGGRTWAPLATTLVYATDDAVLVDPPLTTAQGDAVASWIQASGKRLTHIVATHAHGDHWFTAAMLAARFPGAQVVATADVIHQMHRTLATRAGFWDKILPGQIPPSPVTAVPAPDYRLLLEGHELVIVEAGHSDTDDTTVLHVPDLDLVIAGDVVYNGVHQFLVESGDGGRDAWRQAIDVVAGLKPQSVIAGHKNKNGNDDGARVIAETRRYLHDVDELLTQQAGPVDFFRAMHERYPDHLNSSTLWGSALALYSGR